MANMKIYDYRDTPSKSMKMKRSKYLKVIKIFYALLSFTLTYKNILSIRLTRKHILHRKNNQNITIECLRQKIINYFYTSLLHIKFDMEMKVKIMSLTYTFNN